VSKLVLRPSNISSLPASEGPMPASSFKASLACSVPMVPTTGPNTPSTAQRVSSKAASGGNRQA
jgi:hypothetical protein